MGLESGCVGVLGKAVGESTQGNIMENDPGLLNVVLVEGK